jgi:NitT/TauT family transport system substrate-binding protein
MIQTPLVVSRARALGLLAASGAAIIPARLRPQTTPPIRFGSSPLADSFMLPYYAQEIGAFTRAGLNVQVMNFANSGQISIAAAGNAVDAGIIDPVGMANTYNRGISFAFVGGGSLYSSREPTTMLCLAASSAIRSAKDLEGKSIGLPVIGTITSLGVRVWLQANGADLSTIKFYETPYTTMVPALNRGEIAAAFIAEPFLSQLKRDMHPWMNAFDAIAKSFFLNGVFASRSWLGQNGALAARLAGAIKETARWANAHRSDSAAICSRYSSIPLDVVKAMNRVRYGEMSAQLVQPVLDAAYKDNMIERPVDAGRVIASV